MTMAVASRRTLSVVKESTRKQALHEFCEWLIDETQGTTEIMSWADCQIKLEGLLERKIACHGSLNHLMYAAKLYSEANFGITFWNQYGKGFRAATKRENAITKIRLTKGAIGKAWRAANFKPKVDREDLVFATTKVFGSASHKIEELAGTKEAFYEDFKSKFLKQLKEEARDAKQIETR